MIPELQLRSEFGKSLLENKTPESTTLPETNIAHENHIFLGKYHQNGGFSMAMLVYRRVTAGTPTWRWMVKMVFPEPKNGILQGQKMSVHTNSYQNDFGSELCQ